MILAKFYLKRCEKPFLTKFLAKFWPKRCNIFFCQSFWPKRCNISFLPKILAKKSLSKTQMNILANFWPKFGQKFIKILKFCQNFVVLAKIFMFLGKKSIFGQFLAKISYFGQNLAKNPFSRLMTLIQVVKAFYMENKQKIDQSRLRAIKLKLVSMKSSIVPIKLNS